MFFQQDLRNRTQTECLMSPEPGFTRITETGRKWRPECTRGTEYSKSTKTHAHPHTRVHIGDIMFKQHQTHFPPYILIIHFNENERRRCDREQEICIKPWKHTANWRMGRKWDGVPEEPYLHLKHLVWHLAHQWLLSGVALMHNRQDLILERCLDFFRPQVASSVWRRLSADAKMIILYMFASA